MAFVNSNEYVVAESYIDIFKEWVNNICSKVSTIFESSDSNINENKTVVKVNTNFYNSFHEDLIKEIIDSTENIAHFLKTEYILSKEYYDFREIQRLLIQALKDDDNRLKLEILLNIIEKLLDITNYKFDLLYESSKNGELSFEYIPLELKEEFKEKYDEFHKFLFNSKKEYYSLNKNHSNQNSKKYFNLMAESILD